MLTRVDFKIKFALRVGLERALRQVVPGRTILTDTIHEFVVVALRLGARFMNDVICARSTSKWFLRVPQRSTSGWNAVTVVMKWVKCPRRAAFHEIYKNLAQCAKLRRKCCDHWRYGVPLIFTRRFTVERYRTFRVSEKISAASA